MIRIRLKGLDEPLAFPAGDSVATDELDYLVLASDGRPYAFNVIARVPRDRAESFEASP